jgi:4-amino-4-deoxy-L-arabinose transferase-like glycosyltransferase
MTKTKKNFLNLISPYWETFESYPKLCWIFSLFWLLLVSWIAFFTQIGNISLIDKTEGLYVEVARQIVVTNDWITPRWNGEIFFSYPIGGYWFIALSFLLFGVNEWSARFPIALSAMVLVALGFYTLRYFGITKNSPNSEQITSNSKIQRQLWITAWIGTGILALNPFWIAWGRTAVSDMLLSSSVALAMLAFFLGYAQPENPKIQQRWYLAFPVFMSIATLVKGPIGIILPGLGIVCFLVYLGNFWQIVREIKPIRTILIFLILTSPWYIAATVANGSDFINEFFGLSNFQRFTQVVFDHPGPWYFYLIWLTVLMLPWSVYIPIAIYSLRFWKRGYWSSSPRNSQLGLYAFFWFISILVFFSSAQTKLPGYILPCVPAVAIITTLFWSKELSKPATNNKQDKKWLFLISAILNLIILISLAIASFYSAKLAGSDPAYPTLESSLQSSALPLKLTIIWGIASLLALFLLTKKTLWRWLWSPNLLGFFAFLAFILPPLVPIMDRERQLPFRELSLMVKEVIKPQEEVVLIGFNRYSLVYYSEQKVKFIDNSQALIDYLKKSQNQQIKSETILILSPTEELDKLGLNPEQYNVISQKGVYQLIRINAIADLREKGKVNVPHN